MRKLFVVGFVSVVVLTVWLLYLNYDMTRFEKEHSDLSMPPQSSKNASNKETIQMENTHDPLVNADTSIQSTDSLVVNNTNTDKMADSGDTASQDERIDLQQTLMETGISPELMKIFTGYSLLDTELSKINVKLTPLQEQYSSLSDRRRDIHDQLGEGNLNRTTVNALYAELDEINEWSEENVSTIFELQSEVSKIREKQLTFLKENGFLSWEDFLIPHGETYFNWFSEKTN